MKARFFSLGVGNSRPPSREGKRVLVTKYNVCEGFSTHHQAIFGHQLDVLQFSPIQTLFTQREHQIARVEGSVL